MNYYLLSIISIHSSVIQSVTGQVPFVEESDQKAIENSASQLGIDFSALADHIDTINLYRITGIGPANSFQTLMGRFRFDQNLREFVFIPA